MREEIYKQALLFAENCGYNSDKEKDQLVYDFVSGANYVWEKVFKLYLNGEIGFKIELGGR